MLKNLILTVCLFLCLTRVDAQRRKPAGPPAAPHLEELPQRPLDTLPTDDPETKVILYSNNTWSFYRPSLRTLDSLPVYAQHWDTSQVFAYKSIEYADLPPVIDLKIVKNLSEFTPPVVGNVLSKYGPRRRRNHNGVDIPLKVGEPVRAAFDGRVRYAKYNTGGFGNLVIVRHPNGLETWHAHLSKLNVQVNEYVKTGQVIGFSGNTGRSRGPHLHFEMRYCDQTFDPEFIIDFPTGCLKYQTFALEKSFFNIHSRASEILEEDDDELSVARVGGRRQRHHLDRYFGQNSRSAKQGKGRKPALDAVAKHGRLPYDPLGRHARQARDQVRRIDRPDLPPEQDQPHDDPAAGPETPYQINKGETNARGKLCIFKCRIPPSVLQYRNRSI